MDSVLVRFFIGVIIGSFLVGSSVLRTLTVAEGNPVVTLIASILNSVSYYLSINFIVKSDVPAYIGTCVGSTVVVVIWAWKNKRKKL